MGNRPHPYDKADAAEPRTPVTDDLAPEGMDSESEGDELEAGNADDADVETFEQLDENDHVEPDGARDTPQKH